MINYQTGIPSGIYLALIVSEGSQIDLKIAQPLLETVSR
jgi:hypothetical protein